MEQASELHLISLPAFAYMHRSGWLIERRVLFDRQGRWKDVMLFYIESLQRCEVIFTPSSAAFT